MVSFLKSLWVDSIQVLNIKLPNTSGSESAIAGGRPLKYWLLYWLKTCGNSIRFIIKGNKFWYWPDFRNDGLYWKKVFPRFLSKPILPISSPKQYRSIRLFFDMINIAISDYGSRSQYLRNGQSYPVHQNVRILLIKYPA